MQRVCADDLTWTPLTDIREGGKEMKPLLLGREGAPDNYRFLMIRERGGGATTPRHRHTFDQVRIVLSGRANYGPRRWIEAGELAYFPEGVPYGPESPEGERLGLTLQCGGASGLGFLSQRQVREATDALKAGGEFRGGLYYAATTAAGGRAQDAYEAVWEAVNRRRIVYPKPRYDEPIKMSPANFDWQAQPGQPGVEVKMLGSFTERRHEFELARIAPGSTAMLGPRAGTQLAYVLTGSGSVDGAPVRRSTAFEVLPGNAAQVTASSELELIVIGLPIFVAAKRPSGVV